jgi:hypothetical protein
MHIPCFFCDAEKFHFSICLIIHCIQQIDPYILLCNNGMALKRSLPSIAHNFFSGYLNQDINSNQHLNAHLKCKQKGKIWFKWLKNKGEKAELRGVRLSIAVTTSGVIQTCDFFAFLKKQPGKLTKAANFTMYFWHFSIIFMMLIQFLDLWFEPAKFFIDISFFTYVKGHNNGR